MEPTAKKIQIHSVITCKEDTPVSEIAKKMEEKNDRRVFVTDSKDNLCGIITTKDLVYKVIAEKKHDSLAKDIMIKNVKCIDCDEALEKALEIMHDLKTFVCPVVENKKIIGIVDHNDIVNFIFESANKEHN